MLSVNKKKFLKIWGFFILYWMKIYLVFIVLMEIIIWILLFINGVNCLRLKLVCFSFVVVLKFVNGMFVIGCIIVWFSLVFRIIDLVILFRVRLLVISVELVLVILMLVDMKDIILFLFVLKKLGFMKWLNCVF